MSNIWLNYVSDKMLHVQTGTKKDGTKSEFYNVSFDCPVSASGIATVSVNAGQVKDSTKKDGTVVAGYKNVLLGAPGTKRQVSVKLADGNFARQEMTVEEIAAYFKAGRDNYRAEQAAAEAPAVEPEA